MVKVLIMGLFPDENPQVGSLTHSAMEIVKQGISISLGPELDGEVNTEVLFCFLILFFFLF